MQTRWIAIAAAVSWLAAVTSYATIKPVELAIETSGETLILPSGSVGTLVVSPCVKCAPLSLIAGARARYFIGRTAVSVEDVRRELASRTRAQVVVFYDAKSHELTRVCVSGHVVTSRVSNPTPAGKK
jgi:hypothetical protein